MAGKRSTRSAGDSGICEHNLRGECCKGIWRATVYVSIADRKNQCKECGGSSICEHGRQKSGVLGVTENEDGIS
jgi:hypothetical protein